MKSHDQRPAEPAAVRSGPLPVLPLRDVVIFPFMTSPVLLGRDSTLRAAQHAIEHDNIVFLAVQKNPSVEDPSAEDVYLDGTLGKIVQVTKLPNGLLRLLVDGVRQASITRFTPNERFLEGEITIPETGEERSPELDALIRRAGTLFTEYVHLNRNLSDAILQAFAATEDPRRKLFFIASHLTQDVAAKQRILQTASLGGQYDEVLRLLAAELDILRIEKDIDEKVHESIQKSQKKYLLQEQIRILQDELGSEEPVSPELAKLRKQVDDAHMPQPVRDRAMEEFTKLRKTPPQSPEFGVSRNYLDWLVTVPWEKRTKDNLAIEHVRTILNDDHYGLEKPKDRILEHIAVLNLVKEMRGQILCFVGPPGVGKTSLGKSIARALGRKFVRISLGGVRDEAEIHGHRRTYIGSMPGKIIQSMRRAAVVNPVILMDEIDKMSMDFRGDPASALLEVLDPEQNAAFNDHYLDVDYDLSHVMFITTANVRYNIPPPLLDRMEVIELPGYLDYDKREIARRHIIPAQLAEHGLRETDVVITDEALGSIIDAYTREAGVRNLEREIASVCRKVARDIVARKQGRGAKRRRSGGAIVVDGKKLGEYLGVPKFRQREAAGENRGPGSVTGLAWTSNGGSILTVDATIMSGRETLTLTGQIGEVMQESARAALSYIRANAAALGVPKDFFSKKEIHIHLPEGAIPKDGPSAGITMAVAIISAASNRPARADVAMTGEITLRGNLLAIGGLNEKLLAAQRSGIRTVLIPKENERDLEEIQAKVKEGLTIIPVGSIAEALPRIFPPTRKRR